MSKITLNYDEKTGAISILKGEDIKDTAARLIIEKLTNAGYSILSINDVPSVIDDILNRNKKLRDINQGLEGDIAILKRNALADENAFKVLEGAVVGKIKEGSESLFLPRAWNIVINQALCNYRHANENKNKKNSIIKQLREDKAKLIEEIYKFKREVNKLSPLVDKTEKVLSLVKKVCDGEGIDINEVPKDWVNLIIEISLCVNISRAYLKSLNGSPKNESEEKERKETIEQLKQDNSKLSKEIHSLKATINDYNALAETNDRILSAAYAAYNGEDIDISKSSIPDEWKKIIGSIANGKADDKALSWIEAAINEVFEGELQFDSAQKGVKMLIKRYKESLSDISDLASEVENLNFEAKDYEAEINRLRCLLNIKQHTIDNFQDCEKAREELGKKLRDSELNCDRVVHELITLHNMLQSKK